MRSSKRHRIRFHEKHKGQLFCDESSEQIIEMLVAECDAARCDGCDRPALSASVESGDAFEIATADGVQAARRIVIATGGLSIPKIGATDFGYRVARQFGLRIVEPRPALVPLTFEASDWAPFAPLAGVSLEVTARCGDGRFAKTCCSRIAGSRARRSCRFDVLASRRTDRDRTSRRGSRAMNSPKNWPG